MREGMVIPLGRRAKAPDVLNLIFSGIGGQGSIVASHLLADAFVLQGREVTLAETFTGATRGGSVQSHVRVGQVWSPTIPEDEADFVVGVEPLEGLRAAHQFLRPGGLVLLDDHPILPIGVTTGEDVYPSRELIAEAVAKLGGRVFFVNATEQAVAAGDERMTNVVLLGALVACAHLESIEPHLMNVVEARWKSQIAERNKRAFQAGKHTAQKLLGQSLSHT